MDGVSRSALKDMRIIAKKINHHWLAQFDDGSKEAGVGGNAGLAIQDLLKNVPDRNLTIEDFKPDFANSGAEMIILIQTGSSQNGDD